MSAQREIEVRAYYARCARGELVKAATCEDKTVAQAYLNLADHYQEPVAKLAEDAYP